MGERDSREHKEPRPKGKLSKKMAKFWTDLGQLGVCIWASALAASTKSRDRKGACSHMGERDSREHEEPRPKGSVQSYGRAR